ncbi:MAG: hypothetical protein ACRDEA_12035 [Microcystaceae cyanobacterium]
MARIDGSNGNDILDGLPFGLSDDQIYGYAGNDTLYG